MKRPRSLIEDWLPAAGRSSGGWGFGGRCRGRRGGLSASCGANRTGVYIPVAARVIRMCRTHSSVHEPDGSQRRDLATTQGK
jgi:hypothetical protein